MKNKMKLVVLIGCILTLVNVGIAGTSAAIGIKIEKEDLQGNSTPVTLNYHADARGPYSGSVDQIITFDGADSYIFNKNVIYEWEFGDKNDDQLGYGKYATHIFSEPGIYYVTLTVKNGIGQIYKDITPVYIDRTGDHLFADGGCSYNAEVNDIITFDASDSYSNGAQIVDYFWDFGDGETAHGKQVAHNYDKERVYIVTLDVKDNNGQTRHDVLHADIGRSYSNKNDLFSNIGSKVQDILDILLNNVGFSTGIFCNLLDAKIYTNYNGNEKLTDISGLNSLPKEIDVNDDGDKDILVNDLEFFKSVWATSMFDENSRVWLQFETTLSEVKKLSTDIQAQDDFTVCLQFDFDAVSYYLDLDDPITRIGYHSPDGEEMPTSISITHVLRPYILFRLFGFTNVPTQGVSTTVTHTGSTIQQLNSVSNTLKISNNQKEPTVVAVSHGNEDLVGEIQYLTSQPVQPSGSGEYWPEYGIKIQGSGGGSFSLISQFLNNGGLSKTTVGISYGSSTSSIMYRLSSDSGVLNHETVFQIPGNSAEFFALREKNSDITQISSEFSFNTELVRGISWSDNGVNLGVSGKFDVDLFNLNFENPVCTFNIGELSFSTDGSFNVNFLNGAKLTLEGNSGFTIADLLFNKKGGGFTAEIIGTLNLDIGNTIFVGLAPGELEIGLNGALTLNSDCEFVVNEIGVTVGGEFGIDSVGTVKFTWDSNTFNIDLDAGLTLEINNLNFEVGELTATASLIEIETNGGFGIEWDSPNSLVTIYGGTGASLSVTDFDIIYGSSLSVSIFGSFEIQAGGWVTFGPNTFEAGFEGILDLGINGDFVEFEINGENIKVGGQFSLTGVGGEISFTWDNDEFSLDVFDGPELTVSDLFFEIGEITVTGESVGIGTSGEFIVIWDTLNNEATVSAGSSVSLSITNIEINIGTTLNIKIFGSLEIRAGGSVTFGPNTFEASFSGSLNLGTGGAYVEFEINNENIKVGGLFGFTSGNGGVSFTWDNYEFSLEVTYGPELSVEDLHFEVGELKVTAGEISIGSNGDLSIVFDTANNEVTILSGSGFSFGIEDLNAKIGSILEVSIFGALDVQADGYIILGPSTFEAGFTGSLNLGTGGNYCEFIVNSNIIKVGGDFTLSTINGIISLSWASDSVTFDVSGGPSLSVDDIYFEAGVLKVTGDTIGIGASSEFSVDLNTIDDEITISAGAGASLEITNVNLMYSSNLDVQIIGSFSLQADGWLTFSTEIFHAGFTGTLNLSSGVEFNINGDSISVGGSYSLIGGNGIISLSWKNDEYSLEVSGGPQLSVDDLYFKTEIQNEVFEFGVGELNLGSNGDFVLSWDTINKIISFESEVGLFFTIADVDFSYGSTFKISMIGSLGVEAKGLVSIAPGSFDISGSGGFVLSPGFGFEINTQVISLSGTFLLQGDSGDISIKWTEDVFSVEVSGLTTLTIEDLFFEIDQLKVNSDDISVGYNGLLRVIFDKTNKQFKVGSTLGFGLDNLFVYTKENSIWNQVLSLNYFDITGGGYLLLESGTDPQIEIDFYGQLSLANLVVTPPTSWNCDLSIGSANIWGDATLNLEKDVQSGEFSLLATSGIISGQITNFDAYVKIGIKDFEVSFSNFQIGGGLSLILDDINDEIEVGSQGTLILSNFIADYGDMDIVSTMDLDADGSITATLSQNNLDIIADVDFDWDISLDSTAIGDWDLFGELMGDVVVDAQWGSGTGTVDITINDPGVFNSFGISYNGLSLTLANITLNLGTVSFEWDRDEVLQTGYFLIDSDFSQNICTVNFAEIAWGTKTASIGWPTIETGDFKFTWDIPAKELTINNGIGNLAPTITYEDTSQNLEIFASSLDVQNDYTKTLTLNWYESSGQITGIGVDTANTYLAQYFEIGYTKGTSGNNGKKIALYGLQCDNFYINRVGTDEFEWGGKIYIANQLTFSKLQSDDWKDFNAQWNFQGSEKWITFDRDSAFDITLTLGSAHILGYTFTSEIDLVNAEYFEFKWDLGISGKISIDTNWDSLSTIDLLIEHGTGKVDITANGLRAENWYVAWTAWPPAQWNIQSGGSIQWGGIELDVYYNGEWRHVWPWPWPA